MWTLIYIIIFLQTTKMFVAGVCGGYYASLNDTFTSENYPSPYPHDSRCRYIIMVPEGYSITLTFTDFQLEATHDVVLVKENVKTLFHGSGSKENIPPINSLGNSLYVYFTSDGSEAESGFRATYDTNSVVNGGWSSWLNWNNCTVSGGGCISTRSRDCINPAPSNGGSLCFGDSVESRVCNRNRCPGVCGGYYASLNDTFTSENYPSPYPHHSRCRYIIMVPEGYSITLTFTDFQLEATHDVVLVKENVKTLFHGNGGKENIPPINSLGNSLYVYFTSDKSVAESGFRATYDTNSVVLMDGEKQLFSAGVVGGIAVACIICTSVLCLIVHCIIGRLRQNKGREETTEDINEGGQNYEEWVLRRTTQNYENAEYIRPDDHQGDVRGNTERPETDGIYM